MSNFVEKRAGRFIETLSMFMVRVATVGAVIVLVDVKLTFVIAQQVVSIGSGFSPDLKGAVITAILIGGWTAVKEYWLGSSATGQTQSESMSRIAEASAPAAAAAVAAAGAPAAALKTDDLKVDATGASITIDNKPPDQSSKGPT